MHRTNQSRAWLIMGVSAVLLGCIPLVRYDFSSPPKALTDCLFLLLGSTFLKLSGVTTSIGKLEQRVEKLEKAP